MSVYAHPFLAVLWVLLAIAEFWLAEVSNQKRNLFGGYAALLSLRSICLLSCSLLNHAEAYYYTFWIGQFLFHAIILLYAVRYACRCLRWRPRLPQHFAAQAYLVAGTLVATVVVLRLWQAAETDEQIVLQADQWVSLFLCGLLWMVTLACSQLDGLQHRIMVGFVAAYSVAMITGCLRVYVPMTRVECWAIDLTAQLAVCLWWIRTLLSQPSPA